MAYRPQFVYRPFAGKCDDQVCTYSFDGTNTPALNPPVGAGTLLPGRNITQIPLVMDRDADFFLRGLSLSLVGGLTIRLEDPFSNPLSDSGNRIEVSNYEYPALFAATNGAGFAALDSDDWGVYCPAGSKWLLSIYNPTLVAQDLSLLVVNMHGIKRYPERQCA